MNFELWGLKGIPIGTESWSIFVVVLIALIIFIWLIARLVTRATEDSDPAEVDRQMLTAINDLRRKGDLSQEEFRSIKGQLIDRLKDDYTSSIATRSDKEAHADSTESEVKTSVTSAIECEENLKPSANGLNPLLTTESQDSHEQLKGTVSDKHD